MNLLLFITGKDAKQKQKLQEKKKREKKHLCREMRTESQLVRD